MAELTQTQKTSERVFGKKVDANTCKSAPEGNAGASPLCPIYVRYKDHVIFKNISAPSPIAVVRETIGWVKQQNDELLLIEHDRAIPSQGKTVNGIIILKNCIVEAYSLPLQNNSEWQSNCQQPIAKDEYALEPNKRKTHSSKGAKTP